MRIFYAVNFTEDVKSALHENLTEIKKHTLRGNFTARENFHVTLLFVGECTPSQIPDLMRIADNAAAKINAPQITATIDGLSSFARVGEELLWVGIETAPKDILRQMNIALSEETSKIGIKINGENKHFTPHITIARKVEFWRMSSKDIQKIKFEPVWCKIDSITLMESIQEVDSRTRRTNLVYKPLHEAKFEINK